MLVTNTAVPVQSPDQSGPFLKVTSSPLLTSFAGLTGKVGIFGGSFDPPHAGHLHTALVAKERFNLDLVVFIPTAKNPLKTSATQAAELDRLEMLYSLLEDQQGLKVSPIELTKKPPTYTIDTLREIKSLVADSCELNFIVGSDCLESLPKWKEIEKFHQYAKLIVLPRDSADFECVPTLKATLPAEVFNNLILPAVPIGTVKPQISSSAIRAALSSGKTVKSADLPVTVKNYINHYELYSSRVVSSALGEQRRKPLGHEPQRITKEQTIFCIKNSRVARDIKELGLTKTQLIEHYRALGDDPKVILASHVAQLSALEKLHAAFPESKFIDYSEIANLPNLPAQLVVAIGGDEHFKYVASHIEDTYVLGINSDPSNSNGALLYFDPDTFIDYFKNLETGNFKLEEWSRLTGTINGRSLGLILDSIFVGERLRSKMSRHILNINGERIRQLGSGLLLTTGAGSTGWYDSSVRYLFPNGNEFSKTAAQFNLLLTEPSYGRLNSTRYKHAEHFAGQEIIIESLGSADNQVCCDSLISHAFPRGAVLRVGLSDRPLKVIAPP